MSAFFQLVDGMDFGKIFLVTVYSSIQVFLLTGLTVAGGEGSDLAEHCDRTGRDPTQTLTWPAAPVPAIHPTETRTPR